MLALRRKTVEEPEEDLVYTTGDILDAFLRVPDENWPEALEAHPSLAAALRDEIGRLRNERRAIIEILRDMEEALQCTTSPERQTAHIQSALGS